MYNNILGLLMILFACFREAHLLTVTLQTSSPVEDRSIELRCSGVGPTCCNTETRTWNRDGTVILTSGQTTEKYSESYNSTGQYFSLIIHRLAESDMNHAYSCLYGFANTPSPLILTRDFSFIYPPKESCPMSNDKRHIFGTLNITKCQPSPTFVAYYKDKNWTSFLNETSAVSYSTYFYTRSATMNLPDGLTCGDGEIFTFTVVTGTVETTVCTVDYCKCGECAGKCYGWSTLGTVIAVIFILGGFCFKVPSLAELTMNQKILPGVGLFFCSAVLNLFAVLICWKVCFCIDNTDPWFILLGLGTCLITTAVFIVVTDPNNKDAACKLFSVGLVCLVILHEKIKGKDEENPPPAKEPPSKPEGPLKVVHNKNSVTIKWKAPKRGMPLTQYIIQIGVVIMKPGTLINKATWKDIAIVTPENETYTIENLEENDYFFRVSAKNAVGVSEPLETDKPVHIKGPYDKDPAGQPKSAGEKDKK